MPGHLLVCVMGLKLVPYLQWKAPDLDFSKKDLVETLERIRLVAAVRAGTPQIVLEQLTPREAELVERPRLLEFLARVRMPDALRRTPRL